MTTTDCYKGRTYLMPYFMDRFCDNLIAAIRKHAANSAGPETDRLCMVLRATVDDAMSQTDKAATLDACEALWTDMQAMYNKLE